MDPFISMHDQTERSFQKSVRKKNDIKNPPAVHLWIHSLPDDQHPGFLVSACCDWFNGRVMVCLDISRDFHSR